MHISPSTECTPCTSGYVSPPGSESEADCQEKGLRTLELKSLNLFIVTLHNIMQEFRNLKFKFRISKWAQTK